MREYFLNFFLIWLLLFFSFWSESREIRFPEEELAAESVLPFFPSNQKVTMNRKVKLKNKVSLLSSIDYRADDPFYYRFSKTGEVGFFINEMHGLSLMGIYFFHGVSSIGEFFSKPEQRLQNISFYATEAPHPRYAILLNYNWVPFYGKLSLFKNITTNYNVSLNLGAGALSLIQDQSPGPLETYKASLVRFVPIVMAGINQKIFIGKRVFIHGWLRFFLYHGPNPVWCKHGAITFPADKIEQDSCSLYRSKKKSYDQFDKSLVFRNLVGGGAGLLIP